MTASLLLALAGADAAAQSTTCAREGAYCDFEGRREVFYGSGNQWVSRNFSDGVKCTNEMFGRDPAPGTAKTCQLKPITSAAPKWVNCAREGAMCAFDGRKEVAYGSGNKWFVTIFNGGVKCSSESFLGDPSPGVAKTCRTRELTGSLQPSWVRCAPEGQACKFRGDRKVAYGVDQRLKYRVFRNGAMCTAKNFGDPAPGVAKSCFYDAN
jgi:hypothetical protein